MRSSHYTASTWDCKSNLVTCAENHRRGVGDGDGKLSGTASHRRNGDHGGVGATLFVADPRQRPRATCSARSSNSSKTSCSRCAQSGSSCGESCRGTSIGSPMTNETRVNTPGISSRSHRCDKTTFRREATENGDHEISEIRCDLNGSPFDGVIRPVRSIDGDGPFLEVCHRLLHQADRPISSTPGNLNFAVPESFAHVGDHIAGPCCGRDDADGPSFKKGKQRDKFAVPERHDVRVLRPRRRSRMSSPS